VGIIVAAANWDYIVHQCASNAKDCNGHNTAVIYDDDDPIYDD